MTAGQLGRRKVAFDNRGSQISGGTPPAAGAPFGMLLMMLGNGGVGSPLTAGDGYGNFEDAWAEQFQRSARIRPLIGGEQVLASRLAGVQPYIITVRRDSQTKLVTTGWRVRDVSDAVEFNITAIINKDEKNRYLDMMATAGVAV